MLKKWDKNNVIAVFTSSIFCLVNGVIAVPSPVCPIRLPLLQRQKRLVLPVHSLVCLAAFSLALPLAISLFPQMSQVCIEGYSLCFEFSVNSGLGNWGVQQ